MLRGQQASVPASGAKINEPERLWEVSELRLAAVSGVFLLGALIAGWGDAAEPVVLTLEGVALVVGAYTFVPSTLKRLVKGTIGVGTLMTIAAVGAVILGEVGDAAMLAFLFSISEGLEEYSLARTRRGLRALLSLVPDEATILRDGTQTVVAPTDLRVGDRMLMKPGERIATDGTIREGRTALDVSAITGESVPVEAGPGDDVFAGSINGTGALEVEVSTTAEDNSLARIVRIVEGRTSPQGHRDDLLLRVLHRQVRRRPLQRRLPLRRRVRDALPARNDGPPVSSRSRQRIRPSRRPPARRRAGSGNGSGRISVLANYPGVE